MSKGKKPITKGTKGGSTNNKLSEDMVLFNLIKDNEIKDAFKFYDPDNTGSINRKQLRSILGNFGYTKMNGK